MGATNFETVAWGKSANQAFLDASSDAAWEHGHGGYTGTIAEKGGFVFARGKPENMDAHAYADLLQSIQQNWGSDNRPHVTHWDAEKREFVEGAEVTGWAKKDWEVWDDKWGPALCIPTGREDPAKGREYVFCGMASE